MNKRIRKKKMTQKRNASRRIIGNLEGCDKYQKLMIHCIKYDDFKFAKDILGNEKVYVVLPRMNGKYYFAKKLLEEYKL